MSLFNTSHFPLCHDDGVTIIPMAEFDEIKPGIYTKKGNEEQLSLRDSIKTSMANSLDMLLSAYSNWTYQSQITISIGNIVRVEIPLPSDYVIYSVPIPTAVMGNVDRGEHFFPSLFSCEGNVVQIGTTAHQVEASQIGKEFDFLIQIYCYLATDVPGWKKVLYSGLSNISKGNTNVSVLLLAIAVELYADYLFGKYLAMKGVDELIKTQVVQSVRPWPLKAKRIMGVFEVVLPDYDISIFRSGLKDFKEYVKKPRNKYAHEHSEDISMSEAHSAYCAAFDLLWCFDSLDTALRNKGDTHTKN